MLNLERVLKLGQFPSAVKWTEGNWYLSNPVLTTPLAEVTEEMVAGWIEADSMKDGVNVIKSRLEEQLALLEKSKSIVPPWKPQVFTPNLG